MIKNIILAIFGSIDYQFYIPKFLEVIKESLWPIIVLIITTKFSPEIRKLIGRIKSIKYKDLSVVTVSAIDKEIKTIKEKTPTEKLSDEKRAVSELTYLLSKYQFIGSAWTSEPQFSHAVRFSEKYAGGKLRYIDQFCSDLKNYE